MIIASGPQRNGALSRPPKPKNYLFCLGLGPLGDGFLALVCHAVCCRPSEDVPCVDGLLLGRFLLPTLFREVLLGQEPQLLTTESLLGTPTLSER